MTGEKKVRFGILGASRIALKSVVPAMQRSTGAELAIVGSRDHRHLPLPCPIGSYDDVLKSDVDAVYISLPNALHEEWSIKALEAGKHVWCEKPAALTYASAKRMVEAAERSGKRLMEGFMFLRHPQQARVRELIKDGVIGSVTGFTGAFSFPMPAAGNIRLSKELGGGVLFDAGVYPIRASRFIFGEEPLSVKATLTIDPQYGVDTKAIVELSYSGGRTAHTVASFEEAYRSTYSVVGVNGTIEMERAYAVPSDMNVHVYVRAGGDTQTIAIEPADQFRLMIDEFCAEIRSQKKEHNYEADLLAQARVVEASARSAEENRLVALSEVV